MALVPSGRFKLMETQVLKTAQSLNDPNAFKQNAEGGTPPPRDNIQQQEIGGGETPSAGPAASEGQPSPTPVEGPEAGEQMVPQQGSDQLNTPQDANAATQQQASTMKAYIFKVLEELGVQRRQIENIDKQVFSQEINLDDHTINGHYMIPTFTQNGEIDEQKAQHIAHQIGQKFGLSQRMKLNGRNWRVEFKSMPRQEVMQGGSSFDEFHQQASKGGGGQPQAKAAFTQGEMIKARRDDLYEIMRKIAAGDKKGY